MLSTGLVDKKWTHCYIIRISRYWIKIVYTLQEKIRRRQVPPQRLYPSSSIRGSTSQNTQKVTLNTVRAPYITSFFLPVNFEPLQVATCCVETSGSFYPLTRFHIKEERIPQLQHCKNLKILRFKWYKHQLDAILGKVKFRYRPGQAQRVPGN